MTSASLLELAQRAERASGADRALDADVCELVKLPQCVEPDCFPLVLRKIIERARNGQERFGPDEDCPLYTASLDAAMTLVPDGWRKHMTDTDSQRCICYLWNDETDEEIGVQAATPALALTAAALRAIAQERSGE